MKVLKNLSMKYPQRIAAAALAILLFAQVIIVTLRYVFSVGWPWAIDLLLYCLLIIVLLPAVAVIVGNTAVRVDVFYANWTKARRRVVDRIALLVLFCPAMTYAAWSMWSSVVRSWAVLESSPTMGGLPGYFILKTTLFLYFAALALTALVLSLRSAPYDDGEER